VKGERRGVSRIFPDWRAAEFRSSANTPPSGRVIKCMGDAKCRQIHAGRLAASRGLQHVLSSQRGLGLVTQDKRILEELNDVSFGPQVLRTVPAPEVVRDLIAGERRP